VTAHPRSIGETAPPLPWTPPGAAMPQEKFDQVLCSRTSSAAQPEQKRHCSLHQAMANTTLDDGSLPATWPPPHGL